MTKAETVALVTKSKIEAKTFFFRFDKGDVRVWTEGYSQDRWEQTSVDGFRYFFELGLALAFVFYGYDVCDNQVRCLNWNEALELR